VLLRGWADVKGKICHNGCVVATCGDAVIVGMHDVPYCQVLGDPDGVETPASSSEVLAAPSVVRDGQWFTFAFHPEYSGGFRMVSQPPPQRVIEGVDLAWAEQEIISWLPVQLAVFRYANAYANRRSRTRRSGAYWHLPRTRAVPPGWQATRQIRAELDNLCAGAAFRVLFILRADSAIRR
jgi:hypothetical protein